LEALKRERECGRSPITTGVVVVGSDLLRIKGRVLYTEFYTVVIHRVYRK
jgi:hypothetical protein